MSTSDAHGEDLFGRWFAHRSGESVAGEGTPALPEPDTDSAPADLAVLSTAQPAPASPARSARSVPVPPTHVFPPRRGARRALTLLLLACVALLAGTALTAWRERSPVTAAIAGAVLLLTAVVWAVRAGLSVAHLRVERGVLTILRAGQAESFSRVDGYQRIEVIGRPGRPGWRVVLTRPGRTPYLVDAALVDPAEFMRVLAAHRPDLLEPPG